MRKFILSLIWVLIVPILALAQGPYTQTSTISASGQIITISTRQLGNVNHSFTFSVASGSPSAVAAVARGSVDNGVSYPFIIGTSTNTADTLSSSGAFDHVQFTANYSSGGTFTVVYLGVSQTLNNVIAQSGVPANGQIAYFLAPGVLTANSGVTISSVGTSTIRNCATDVGTDAGAKIQNCIANLPSTGGIADARGLQGAQSTSSDFFSGVTKKGRLLLGATTLTTSVAITIPSNWTIEGIDSNVSIIKASGALSSVLNGTGSVGVTISGIQIDGNNAALNGITLDNAVVGSSTVNRIYQSRIYNTTTRGVSMDNNGDSTLEDLVFNIASGVSIHWNDIGGNINLTRVTAINANDRTQLAFQTAALVDVSLRGLEIIDTSQQLRLLGGYLYGVNGGAVFKIDSGKVLAQLDGIGTRFEITDALQSTGLCAIDGKFGTGILLSNSRFGNASDLASKNVFCANFGSANGAGLFANLWMFGGTVATDVGHIPTFNPSTVIVQCMGFVTGAGTGCEYGSAGYVGNNGTATFLTTANLSSQPAEITRGTTGQTSDIHQWQNVGGVSTLAAISATGDFYGASVRGIPVTYANRPSNPQEGMILDIIDCAVTTGNVTTGGMSHHNIVVYNGTNWVVLFNLS